MLDPWIIEEILKKEEAERRRKEQESNQPTVPADDPRENPEPERRDDAPKPGYEMPDGDRGVQDIPLGEIDINPSKRD